MKAKRPEIAPERWEIMMQAIETLEAQYRHRMSKEDLEDLKQDAFAAAWICEERYDEEKGDLGIYIWTSIKDLPKRRKNTDFSMSRRDNQALNKARYLFPDDVNTQRKYWVEELGKDGAAFDNLHKKKQELPGQASFDGMEFGNVQGDQEHQDAIEDQAALDQIYETSELWEQELNERQRRVAALYLSPKIYSNRKIARMVGCDDKTVATDIQLIHRYIKFYGFGIGSI